MLLTLRWMDNLQQIECHQITYHLFLTFTLHAEICCFERKYPHPLFSELLSKQTKSSPEFSRLGCHTKGGNWGRASPGKTKNLNFPLLLNINLSSPSSLDHRPHIRKKCISNSFQANFNKTFPVVYIFSNTIMNNLKKLI